MYRVFVKFTVRDFAAWKQKFDAGAAPREEAGLRTTTIARSLDEPTQVMVVFHASDVARAKAHLTDPAVKKKQADAGFLAPPELFFGELS